MDGGKWTPLLIKNPWLIKINLAHVLNSVYQVPVKSCATGPRHRLLLGVPFAKTFRGGTRRGRKKKIKKLPQKLRQKTFHIFICDCDLSVVDLIFATFKWKLGQRPGCDVVRQSGVLTKRASRCALSFVCVGYAHGEISRLRLTLTSRRETGQSRTRSVGMSHLRTGNVARFPCPPAHHNLLVLVLKK